MKALGELRPDPVSEMLEIEYMRFCSPAGVDGLCYVEGNSVRLLALVSRQPGTGQLREFLRQLKEEAALIEVLLIENPVLQIMLEHYGFEEILAVISHQGWVEMVKGMAWVKGPSGTQNKVQSPPGK